MTVCLAASLLFIALAARSSAQAPGELKVKGYVGDFAGVLSASSRDQLTALCTEVEQKTQAQIAVVTVKSLGGRTIEDYSIELATRLGIGPKSTNRGVLILLAVDDHRYRIEVGYGLEAILPDGKVGGFGREAVPYLRANDYDSALLLMTRRVADVIAADRGVTLTGGPLASPESEGEERRLAPLEWLMLILFALFVVSLARMMHAPPVSRRMGRGWWIGPVIGSGLGGGLGGGFRGGGFGGGFGGGGGGFGGFGGGGFGGGGASGSW